MMLSMLVGTCLVGPVLGFAQLRCGSGSSSYSSLKTQRLNMHTSSDYGSQHDSAVSRRQFVSTVVTVSLALIPSVGWAVDDTKEGDVSRPRDSQWVDLDGALGITWGGKDRCQPEDEECRNGGQAASDVPIPPPPNVNKYSISDKCFLDIDVAGKPAGRIIVGLFGEAAPASVAVFSNLCQGDLMIGENENIGPFSYIESYVERVDAGKAIVFGKIKTPSGLGREARQTVFAPERNSDTNPLKHDVAGLVSVEKGGESFIFYVTSAANPQLDRTGLVIGQVLEGMDVLARLNSLPTNGYTGAPLRKVSISRSGLLGKRL